VLVAAACSGGDDEAGSESGDPARFEEVSGEVIAADDAADDAGGDSPAAPAADGAKADLGSGGAVTEAVLQPIDTGRDIIFTAVIQVEVADVALADQQARTAIQGLGGLLFGQQTTTEGITRTTLTFKVDPKDFQTALSSLGELGFLRNQQISADDVTERVVDLQSQIITSEASVERLRALLERAATLPEIADVERGLLERETTLERLRGQLRTIQDQVSLATITVTLTQKAPGPELEIEQTAYLAFDEGTTCPGFNDLAPDEGENITICYRLTNTGDTFLGEIDLRDDGLELELDDMIVVSGSLDQPLAVGASLVLAAEIQAELGHAGRAQATAVAVSENGTSLQFGAAAARDDMSLDVVEDTSLPGFLDGFSAGFEVIRAIWDVLVVSLGFALVFIWLIPVLWWARRRFKRKMAAKAAKAAEEKEAADKAMTDQAQAQPPPPTHAMAAAAPPPAPTHKTDPPKSELPKSELPKSELSKSELPKSELSKSESLDSDPETPQTD